MHSDQEGQMKTSTLPRQPDAKSPAGADIRFVMDGPPGNMIHGTVPPHQVNRATVHATVTEFWYVLEGVGEIWRDDGVESRIDALVPGTAIDIPAGTAFQYRNTSDVDLTFICIAMPPWPGDSEADYVEGRWQPTI
jgi:mannose-6-phosphate isomerase-like protein (cupin superfamily)